MRRPASRPASARAARCRSIARRSPNGARWICALREAALAAGYAWKPDLNAPTGEGVSCNPINSRDGQRVTTNDGYLEPARGRANLTIRGGALVDRVLFDGRPRARRARAASSDGDGTEIAAREVVLCGGRHPQPRDPDALRHRPGAALAGLGIPVLQDLPAVGQHFMDHPILRATLALKPEHAARGRGCAPHQLLPHLYRAASAAAASAT